MAKKSRRPKNREELDNKESRGLWQAQALSKEIAESSEKITLEVILRLHRIFFEEANPGIAGRFRKDGEDIKKLNNIEPVPGRMVQEKMYEFWRNLDYRLSLLPKHPKVNNKKHQEKWLDNVIEVATWVQHQIAAIHPFVEGNGRMARLMTNVILRRFGLQPSAIKYEGEDRVKYLAAMQQIDNFQDYEPLKTLIARSMFNTYKKVYEVTKKAATNK